MEQIKHIKGFGGEIKIYSNHKNFLLAKPSGYVSAKMAKVDLATIAQYEKNEFYYFVDITGFVIPSPFNLWYIRKFKDLPKLKKYIIITENPILKMVLKLSRPIIQYTSIINTIEFENLKKELLSCQMS